MSVKPSVVPWDSTLANIVAVTGTHQTNGYSTNETPVSGEWNALMNNAYTWFAFLNAMCTVAGVANADINIGSGGGATGTITAAGLITASGGVTCGANTNVIISGTGLYKRGAKVTKLPTQLASFSASNGFGPGSWTPAANGNTASIPLVLQEGERMTQVKAKVQCGTTDTFQLKVFRFNPATQSTLQLGSTATSAGHAGATEDLVVGSLTEVCSSADAFNYYATVTVSAFGAGTLTYYGSELTTDVP